MMLHIDDSKTVADLQEHFSVCFPSLKIEFYDEAHHFKEPSSPEHQISPESTIGSIRKKHEPGNLEILSNYTTGKVEQDFKDKFGLNVQIFRNENNAWVQTSATDTFNLKEQSDIASDFTHLILPKFREQKNEYEE
jgi:hypothetical protein